MLLLYGAENSQLDRLSENVSLVTLRSSYFRLSFLTVYANSLLATLNTRTSLRGRGQDMDDDEDLDLESQHTAEVSFPVFQVGHNMIEV